MRRNTGGVRVRMDPREGSAEFEAGRHWSGEGIAAGRLRNVDGEYLTAAAIGLAQEIGEKMMLRDNPDPKEAAEFAANLILSGVPGLALKE